MGSPMAPNRKSVVANPVIYTANGRRKHFSGSLTITNSNRPLTVTVRIDAIRYKAPTEAQTPIRTPSGIVAVSFSMPSCDWPNRRCGSLLYWDKNGTVGVGNSHKSFKTLSIAYQILSRVKTAASYLQVKQMIFMLAVNIDWQKYPR